MSILSSGTFTGLAIGEPVGAGLIWSDGTKLERDGTTLVRVISWLLGLRMDLDFPSDEVKPINRTHYYC